MCCRPINMIVLAIKISFNFYEFFFWSKTIRFMSVINDFNSMLNSEQPISEMND